MAVVNTLIGHIKGPKGDTGETGATGATGAAGADATVTVGSTTTVPYGQTARVTNTGTPGAAVFNFTIPQGKPGEQTTKLDALTLDALTEPSASFPVPAIGDNGSTLFGKISKWFSDMSALVATKFNAANVVNNLTTTVSGYALDARQGKVLYNAVTPSANSTSFVVKNGSVTSGGYIKIGHLVIVNMRIAMNAALSEYNYLVTGLPRPVTTATEGNPVGTVANNLNKSITLVLAGGAGGFFLGAGAGLSNTQAIVLSCVYVSVD